MSGRFDQELAARARKAQQPREAADYEAWDAPPAEAESTLALAGEFISAVEELLGE